MPANKSLSFVSSFNSSGLKSNADNSKSPDDKLGNDALVPFEDSEATSLTVQDIVPSSDKIPLLNPAPPFVILTGTDVFIV